MNYYAKQVIGGWAVMRMPYAGAPYTEHEQVELIKGELAKRAAEKRAKAHNTWSDAADAVQRDTGEGRGGYRGGLRGGGR